MRDAALVSGDTNEALAWYRRLTPELFEEPPQVTPQNIVKAADLGLLLQRTGDPEKARGILERVVTAYDELYVRGAANYPLGIANVDALALLGRHDEAIAMLQKLVDDGWRILWRWSTVKNPNHDSLRNIPEYQQLLADIERDLARRVEEFGGMDLR